MPTNATMKTCPGCGEGVSRVWTTCRACGTLLMTPPAPVAAFPGGAAPVTPADPSPPAPPNADEQFFAPASLQRVTLTQAPAARRGIPTGGVVALVVVAALAVAGYTLVSASSGHAHGGTPVVLPAEGPQAGVPGSLQQVVRIQAESSRQVALAAIAQEPTAQNGRISLSALQQREPSLQWFPADQSSTDPHEVSVLQTTAGVTIAIAASSKDVCAFAQWAPGAVTQYVTMGNMRSCRATDAPPAGWSAQRGGSASDLPPDGY